MAGSADFLVRRSVCSHVGALVLPNLVSVPRVKEVFDAQGRCLDGRMEKLIRNLATSLLDYIEGAICPRIALEAIVRGEAEAEEIL